MPPRPSSRISLVILVFIVSLALADSVLAVEGGMQRPISGMQIAPFAGVIPPEPGFAVAVSEIYYSGSIGGAANVEIGGLLVANVDVKASFTPITFWAPTGSYETGKLANLSLNNWSF